VKTSIRSGRSDDLGKLILRVTLGLLILFHGADKLMHGVGGIESMLARHDLPSVLAYFVYVGEVLAPLMLLIGLMTRLAALTVAVNMVVAILLAHSAQLLSLSNTGGWALELQGMFLGVSITVSMIGAGRYSVGGVGGRYN